MPPSLWQTKSSFPPSSSVCVTCDFAPPDGFFHRVNMLSFFFFVLIVYSRMLSVNDGEALNFSGMKRAEDELCIVQ